MEYEFATTTLPFSNAGIVPLYIPEGSYIVSAVPMNNQIAIGYWQPKKSIVASIYTELLVAADYYELPQYVNFTTGKITPSRLRYLGPVTINNGENTYHVFEIQSEIFHPHDGTVG